MINTILWDLDGTLLDTSPGVFHTVCRVAEAMALKVPSALELRSFVGPPLMDSFQRYYGMSENKAYDATQLFRKLYAEDGVLRADFYPQTLDTLAGLKQKGYRMGVATGKGQPHAETILHHFGIDRYMDVIFGTDERCTLLKPDIIKLCLQALNAAPQETVLIGDSIYDLRGAEDCHISFIGVDFGFGFQKGEDIGYPLLSSMEAIDRHFEVLP